MIELKKNERLRVRRWESQDDWCYCVVELLSPNGMSAGLRVIDGVIRPKDGGLVTGFLPVSLTEPDEAWEISSETRLEIEPR
jgi:hypothetical protein